MTIPEGINTPGVYEIPVEAYIRDPVEGGSLSRSGAKKLIPPSTPARFRWDMDHPPDGTPEQDLGKIAHRFVLGAGPEIEVIDYDDRRTKVAREAIKAATVAGRLPMLRKDYGRMTDMVSAVHAHPKAGPLLDPGSGDAEQTVIWHDEEHGIWRRALLDWLPIPDPTRPFRIPDYKTCKRADPESISKAIDRDRLHMQGVWYPDGIRAVGMHEDPGFVLIFQEVDPPYLVNVVEVDPIALDIGRILINEAIRVFVKCRDTGIWPGYSDDVIDLVGVPPWVERRFETELASAELMARAGGRS